MERGIYSRGLIKNIHHIAQHTQFIIAFSIDPWNCATRGGDEYANVAYCIDWINDKIWEDRQFNARQSSGSIKSKSHLSTLSFLTGIYLL